MTQQLSKAQIRFQAIKRNAKEQAILRIQIRPILQANPNLTDKQAKQIYDRAQEFNKA